MFTPLPMRRVHLMVVREEAANAALTLARLGVFEPEIADVPGEQMPDYPAQDLQRLMTAADAKLAKVLAHFRLTPQIAVEPDDLPPPLHEVSAIAEWLDRVWERCSAREESERRLQERRKHLEHLLDSLATFTELDFDLGLLNAPHGFLDVRVGTVPRVNVDRLSEAIGLAGYRLQRFFTDDDYTQTLIVGPVQQREPIRSALEAATWSPLPVPAEFHGRPEEIRRSLEREQTRLAREASELEAARAQEHQAFCDELTAAAETLALARPYAYLADSLRGRGGLAMVSGWTPAADLARVRDALQRTLGDSFWLSSREPLPEERNQVPSACRHARWLAPFVSLVGNYGLPRYREFDPTILFAVSYVVMFGMMFGDVGHGLLIAAAAPLLRRRFPQVVPFALLCGLSSALFGVFYGSLFGYEQLIPALWVSPLHHPLYMLKVALLAGTGFILLATVLTIRNRLVAGEISGALYHGSGLAGLLFYLSLLYAAWRLGTGQAVGAAGLSAMAVPLLVVMVYGWKENDGAPPVERSLIVCVEAFETVMSYLSGTLSFLRLAAFSLNHVALAIAVFTLAQMLDTLGYWITVVAGNLVILVLEGAIVMIQALRLEYYEGFSRYFSGRGRAFRPLRLTFTNSHAGNRR